MFAIETTSRVKFIFMNRKATKILLLANFSLHDTCHRTEIFKRPVFLPFGRTFFEQRNTNKNITFLTEPLKSLQVFPQGRSFLKKQKFHVMLSFWQNNMARPSFYDLWRTTLFKKCFSLTVSSTCESNRGEMSILFTNYKHNLRFCSQ